MMLKNGGDDVKGPERYPALYSFSILTFSSVANLRAFAELEQKRGVSRLPLYPRECPHCIPSVMLKTVSSSGWCLRADHQPLAMKRLGVCRNALAQSGCTRSGIVVEDDGGDKVESMMKIHRHEDMGPIFGELGKITS